MKTIPNVHLKNPFAPRQYGELQKITERVYLMRNITNSSFVVGDRCVAVIDTQVNYPSAVELLKFIRSVTAKPIGYVINTHYHWDHTNGNQIFKKEGAVVVSSRLTKDFMARRAPRQKEFLASRGFELGHDPLLPETTFENEYAIDLGGTPLRLFFAGRAETDDATAIHVTKENILMTGDTVMTGSFPIFGQPVWDEGLESDAWIKTIQNLMSLKPTHVIPGHGPLAHELEVNRLVRIEKYFLEEVGKLIGEGLGLSEILENLEGRLPDWMKQIPLVWGTPRYAILRVWRGLTKKATDSEPGWQKFKPSAIPAADEKRVGEKTASCESVKDFFQMAAEAKEGGDAGLRLSVLRKATEVFADSNEALTAYAEALIEESRREASVLEKGDFFEAARKSWEKVLLRDPRHIGALLGEGRYHVMMAYRGGDDPAKAMALLGRAVEAGASGRALAEAEFYLGMGYRRLGDEKNAAFQFEKALKADPAFDPARIAKGSDP